MSSTYVFILFFIICSTWAFADFKFDYGGTLPSPKQYYGGPKRERSTASSYGQAINFGQNGQQIRDGIHI